jgi:hypothetical protein
MNGKKKRIILLSGILLVIIFPCLCFIHHDQVAKIVLAIRSYQSRGKITENHFDLIFSQNKKRIFKEKTKFIGSTRDGIYGCQFKIPSTVFNMCLAKSGFNISQNETDNKEIFKNITKYVQQSELTSYSQYKDIVYNESGIFIKDTSDLYVRGPIYIFAADYTDDILLVTICIFRI